MSRTFIRPPTLRTMESAADHRAATWLELFYDLVFVVAVANLGHRLLVDVDAGGILSFVGLFVPLWWAWAQYTFYADRYDTDDLGQRLLAVVQMVAIALMAASISGDVADDTRAFAAANVVAWAVLIAMYTRARRHVAGTRQLVTGYINGFSIATAIWFVSIFTPAPWRYVLWVVGQAVSMATPYLVRRVQATVPLSASHLPERFGLFTILVLGESIAAVVAGLGHRGWKPAPTVAAIVGVVIASSLWWLYFDNADGRVVRRDPDQVRAWRPTAWLFSHLPLAISLVAAGIGVEILVAHTGDTLPAADRWIMVGGTAAALLSMAVILVATESSDSIRRHELRARIRVAGAGILVVVGLASGAITTLPLAVTVMAVLIAQVAADVVISDRARST
jgi:low temperature requirement protein LtrA